MAAMYRRVPKIRQFLTIFSCFLVLTLVSDIHAGAIPPKNSNTDTIKAGIPHKSVAGQPNVGFKNIMLSKLPECQQDIASLCKDVNLNHNFDVLDCLQKDPDADISEGCQHKIWVYKHNLTKDDRFESAGKGVCSEDFQRIAECDQLEMGSGQRIPCMIEYMENVTDKTCQQFLLKMAKIVFSDFRMVYHFMEHCREDVEKQKCGRLDTDDDDEKLHAQGKTIVCLAGKITKLKLECKKQVLRVAELQADDYHLDRPLFYACRDVREHVCGDVPAGGGKVYECLYKHKNHRKMTDMCREKLTVRQSMMAEDVAVEKTFFTACLHDIKANKCLKDATNTGDATRFKILMCLENAMALDRRLDGSCIEEMRQMRQQLMADYQISPEIVVHCEAEINEHCEGVQHQGKTLHCLFELANPNPGRENVGKKEWKSNIGASCKAALEDLMLEANVGQDFTVDRVLAEACEEVIENDCQHALKEGKALNCLMEKVDSEHMTDECEDRLLEIQYFMVRDFRLEPELFKACRKDARELCNAEDDWYDIEKAQPRNNPNILMSCLYRHIDAKDEEAEGRGLSNKCLHQVKKTLKKRAKHVDLEPSIEAGCLKDLGLHCSDMEHYGKGKELACLQDHLDELEDDCEKAMVEFTVIEQKDLDIDTILMNACTPMIKEFCGEHLDNGNDAEKVMECLIDHKHHMKMDAKCAAGVEHHQIIQMKNIKFSPRFKEACKQDVKQFCHDMTQKSEIVVCLSEIVREDILKGDKPRLHAQCKNQLRVEVLQRGETIKLDKDLLDKCSKDIQEKCSGVHQGNAEMIECLRSFKKQLNKECHTLLFRREQDEAALGADYLLFKSCKVDIKKFCKNEMMKGETGVLNCLKRHKDDSSFDPHCRKIVMRRALEETKDFRLNPSLTKSCHKDIPKFCGEEMQDRKDDEELEGKVINCLKRQLIKKRLSRECMLEIKLIIRETHLDIEMDPVLMHACQREIKDYCSKYIEDHEQAAADGGGGKLQFVPNDTGNKLEECLQQKLFEGKIDQKTSCAREITRIVEEISIDVNIDPLLNNACIEDLTHWCGEITSGEGRKMSCLLSVLEDTPSSLKSKCHEFLAKRKALWEFAAKGAPAESLSDLHQQVMNSPARSYLLGVLMTIIGIIFIVGITCGRVTKRVTTEQKNK